MATCAVQRMRACGYRCHPPRAIVPRTPPPPQQRGYQRHPSCAVPRCDPGAPPRGLLERERFAAVERLQHEDGRRQQQRSGVVALASPTCTEKLPCFPADRIARCSQQCVRAAPALALALLLPAGARASADGGSLAQWHAWAACMAGGKGARLHEGLDGAVLSHCDGEAQGLEGRLHGAACTEIAPAVMRDVVHLLMRVS